MCGHKHNLTDLLAVIGSYPIISCFVAVSLSLYTNGVGASTHSVSELGPTLQQITQKQALTLPTAVQLSANQNHVDILETPQTHTLEKAAKQQDIEAQYQLAALYERHARNAPLNLKQAFYWYQQAAQNGHQDAQFSLATYYLQGLALSKPDIHQAAHWFKQAAKQGNIAAAFNLALMYDHGQGLPQNSKQAIHWYRQAARQGEAGAQYNLGLKYLHGTGLIQNKEQADNWIRKAAEGGNPAAQYRMGLVYEQQHSTPQNDNQMLYWYEQAALSNYPQAQFALAKSLCIGRGIPQPNLSNAIYWYYQAAVNGQQDAQYHLGTLLAYGVGTAQDLVQAAYWLTLAQQQRHPYAHANRNYVMAQLTPQQHLELEQLLQQPQISQHQDKEAHIQ